MAVYHKFFKEDFRKEVLLYYLEKGFKLIKILSEYNKKKLIIGGRINKIQEILWKIAKMTKYSKRYSIFVKKSSIIDNIYYGFEMLVGGLGWNRTICFDFQLKMHWKS